MSSQQNLFTHETSSWGSKNVGCASGADLETAIRADGIFPLARVRVFTLGQNTGELDDLLLLTTIIEPMLIIGLSVIIGFVLLATLPPSFGVHKC